MPAPRPFVDLSTESERLVDEGFEIDGMDVISALAFDHANTRLAVGLGTSVFVYDIADGALHDELRTVPPRILGEDDPPADDPLAGGRPDALAFSPDGRWLAAAAAQRYNNNDELTWVVVWDRAVRAVARTFPETLDFDFVLRSVPFVPPAGVVVHVAPDGASAIWGPRDPAFGIRQGLDPALFRCALVGGPARAIRTRHRGSTHCVAVSPDGTRVARAPGAEVFLARLRSGRG